jgi:hypothetical protein
MYLVYSFKCTVIAFSLKAKSPNHDLPKSQDKMPIHGNVQSVSQVFRVTHPFVICEILIFSPKPNPIREFSIYHVG